MSLINLPDEILLLMLCSLLNGKDRYALATSSKKLWSVATRVLKKSFILRTKISALDLRRITALVIEDKQHKPDLIKHVLKYAVNLQSITFCQQKISFREAEVFMIVERNCTFFVPATAYNPLMLALEESENRHVRIEIVQSQLDNIQTPEELKEKLKMLKDAEKAKYVRDNSLNVRLKDNLSHIIQSYVDLLFSPKELVLNKSFYPNEKVDTAKKANEMIPFSARFLESVVVMARHWFFITSFCIFVHEKKLDDCSDDSRVGVQEDSVALIRKKTRAGKDFFELTIRFSNVELLCTSGFFCHVNRSSITPFFGSSIQNLPKDIVESYGTVYSKDIFIPKKEAPFVKTTRLLNQYIKKQSVKKWMLISQRFEKQGLSPAHPLHLKTDNKVQEAASLVLNIFAYKSIDRASLKQAKSNLGRLPESSLTASGKLVKHYINTLNQQRRFSVEKFEEKELKKDMLSIYEGALAGAVKRQNASLTKKASSLYNKT